MMSYKWCDIAIGNHASPIFKRFNVLVLISQIILSLTQLKFNQQPEHNNRIQMRTHIWLYNAQPR